jgi:hypothetical protein
MLAECGIGSNTANRIVLLYEYVQLEYLDATVLRREVGEIRVVVGRDPAC